MGCGSSKNQIGLVPDENKPTPREELTSAKSKSAKSRTIKVGAADGTPKKDRKSTLKKSERWNGSRDSISSQTSLGRGGSASSKNTVDSGIDDQEDACRTSYITEGSDIDLVRQVEDQFREPNIADFNLIGTSVPRRQSANDRERSEESTILANLRQEGLIQRPMSRAQGGLSFEVIEDSTQRMMPLRPPIRLAKLEKREKKHKRTLTSEDIASKLEKAEARKRELEQQRLQRIQLVSKQSDVNATLDSFAKSQEMKQEVMKTKDEIAAENREKKILELQQKLKAKQERAERVRRRKQSVIPNEEQEDMPVRMCYTEDTPVGKSINLNETTGETDYTMESRGSSRHTNLMGDDGL